MSNCPRCGRAYVWCNCGDKLIQTKSKKGKVSGRSIIRAAIALQKLGMPITTGSERPEGVERKFSTNGMHQESDDEG